MSRLDPELAAALQVLECAFGRPQILDVHSTLPERRPAPAPATAGPDHRRLFDPEPPSRSRPDAPGGPSNLEVMP